MNELKLNYADMQEVMKVLDEYGQTAGQFKIIRHGETGIGYCISVEFDNIVSGRLETTRVEVVGPSNWQIASLLDNSTTGDTVRNLVIGKITGYLQLYPDLMTPDMLDITADELESLSNADLLDLLEEIWEILLGGNWDEI